MTNFIIYGLPRSRTYWLSKFLTYKDHTCTHEIADTLRVPDDYKEFFKQKNVGTSETGVAQGWWLIEDACPGIKTVVVHRPVEESVNSLFQIDLDGVAVYDKDLLMKHYAYGERMLKQISSRKDVLSVDFHDLNKMEVCKKIFEHCLPYEFDVKWWGSLKNKNLQCDFRKRIIYFLAHKEEINNFKRLCKLELIKLRRNNPDNSLWNVGN